MTMQNFSLARTAMVVSQLEPSGIQAGPVRAAFADIPREMFVPDSLRGVCYLDNDVALGQGRFMLEPLVLARMITALDIGAGARVLDVGCGFGYSSAVLARLAVQVTALDSDEKMLHEAHKHWETLGIQNISPILGELETGYEKNQPYDSILINGAVAQPPDQLIRQLAAHGRLVCVVKPNADAVGQVTLFKKDDQNRVMNHELFDAGSKYLKGFEPKVTFSF